MEHATRQKKNVAVLGGGFAGLFSARALVDAGFEVSLIYPLEGRGEASSLSQGILGSKGLTQADAELFGAKLAGQRSLYEELQGKNVTRIDGVMEPFADEADCERILARVYRKSDFTAFGTKKLSDDDARMDGFDKTAVAGALLYPGDYWLDVNEFLEDLRADLLAKGVTIRHDEVLSFSSYNRGWSLKGAREIALYDELVLATGCGTDLLLMASGFPALGLVPSHGVVLRGVSRDPSLSFAFVREVRSAVFHQGRILLGGTATTEWQDGDAETHAATLRETLLPFIRKDLLTDVQWQHRYGVRVRVKDRMPVVGAWRSPSEEKPVYVCTGLYKNGLALAGMCATHLARVIAGEDPLPETKAFDVSRLNPR